MAKVWVATVYRCAAMPPPMSSLISKCNGLRSDWVHGGSSHPTRCGYSNKLYYMYDYVSPILDSLVRLQNRMPCLTVEQFLKVSREKLSTSDDCANRLTSSALCPECKTQNPMDCEIDEEGFTVCKECGIVLGRSDTAHEYKDTHTTDKSMARADAPKESRRDRFASTAVGSSSGGKGTAAPGNARAVAQLCHAARRADAVSEKSENTLSRHENKKLGAVLQATDNLMCSLHPVDDRIQRVIRMTTERTFRRGVQHMKVCTHAQCQMPLVKRPSIVIAHNCFVYAVEELASGSCEAVGVNKTQISNLHAKVKANAYFNSTNSSQHQVCNAMIHCLASSDINQACRIVDASNEQVSGMSKCKGVAKNVALKHCAGLSPVMVRVRECIVSLSRDMAYEDNVQKAAILALTVPEICQAVKRNNDMKDGVDSLGNAYLLLRSVQAIKDAKCGASSSSEKTSHNAQMNVVGMRGKDVETLVAKMQKLLPPSVSDVASGAREEEEDSLYS